MKHNVLKRVLALALIVLTAVACIACGKPSEPEDVIDFGTTPDAGNTTNPITSPDGSGDAAVTTPDPANPDATPDPAVTPGATPGTSPSPEKTPKPTPFVGETKETPKPVKSYDEYRKLNADVVGWIKISNTKVDYPVVKGSDNSYYLTHNVEKSESDYGAIYMDYRCDPKDKHIVIYGHNMRNGTMFGTLHNYSVEQFFKSNDTIKVKFGSTEHTYKIFSTYTVDASKNTYMVFDFDSGSDFASQMNALGAKSKFKTNVVIDEDDQVLTLSTCNRQDYEDGREVVHAVRVK